MQKLVVRAPNWLGDITMAMPFFLLLPKVFEGAEIHVIVKPEYEGFIQSLPYKLHTHTFTKKNMPGLRGLVNFKKQNLNLIGADLYIALPPSFSSALMGKVLGAKENIGFAGEGRGFLFSRSYKRPTRFHRADEFIFLLEKFTSQKYNRELGAIEDGPYFEDDKKSYIVVNVNSEASSRRMPLYQWDKLLKKYDGETFVFVGAPKEREWVSQVANVVQKNNEVINLAGKTEIMELARVLKHAKLVITNDSGPAHLAAYVGAPVITWIGAADAENTVMLAKDPSRVNVFSVPLPCAPCLKNSCPLNTIDCLTKIEMDDVHTLTKKYI